MPSVRSAMIIFLHTIISCNQPSPCRPEDLTLLRDTLRAIINTIGTPPSVGAMCQVWSCLTVAFTLIEQAMNPTAEHLQLFSDIRPPCGMEPGNYQCLAALRTRLDCNQLVTVLQSSITTLRELQLAIDCAAQTDYWDEQSSICLYFCEIECMNALHILSPATLPQQRPLPTQPVEIESQTQEDVAVEGGAGI